MTTKTKSRPQSESPVGAPSVADAPDLQDAFQQFERQRLEAEEREKERHAAAMAEYRAIVGRKLDGQLTDDDPGRLVGVCEAIGRTYSQFESDCQTVAKFRECQSLHALCGELRQAINAAREAVRTSERELEAANKAHRIAQAHEHQASEAGYQLHRLQTQNPHLFACDEPSPGTYTYSEIR